MLSDEMGYHWQRIEKLESRLSYRARARRGFKKVPAYELRLPVRATHKSSHFKFVRGRAREARYEYGRTLAAPGFLDCFYTVSKHDEHTCKASFRKRLVPEMPVPEPSLILKLRRFVRNWLNKHMIPLEACNQEMLDNLFETWLLKYTKPQTRKDDLRRLYYQRLSLVERDMGIKSFGKSEFYEKENLMRYINSRSDEYKVHVAGPCHYVEHELFFSRLSRFFIKGKTLDEMPPRIEEMACHPFFYQSDYTSFESGFSPEYTNAVECELWKHMFQYNPDVLADFDRAYRKGASPRVEKLNGYYFFGKVIGARMSGEMWTSLANGFSNLMNFFFLCSQHGIDESQVDCVVEGDDGVFGLPRPALKPADFESLGFKIKMEYVSDIDETELCCIRYSRKSLRRFISPGLAARCLWTCLPQYSNATPRVAHELLRAKAMSLYCLGRYSPIAQALSLKILQLTSKVTPRWNDTEDWWFRQITLATPVDGFTKVDIPFTDRIRWANLYGVSVELQLLIEQEIESAQSLSELNFDYSLTDVHNTFWHYRG